MALTPFRHVTGVDPSANMIYAARKKIVENRREGVKAGLTIDFVQGPAEKLDFLPDDSTDLIIAGTYLGCFIILFDRHRCALHRLM